MPIFPQGLDVTLKSPVAGLLSREPLSPELEEFLEDLAVMLEQCVNCGTHIFAWCDEKARGGGHHHGSILLLFRHVLEMIDGVSVLVRHSCIDPCQALLRSAMEAELGIEYILEDDTVRRALAYQVAHIHKRIAEHTRNDSNTEAGREFQKVFQEDKIFSAVKLPPNPSRHAIDRLAKVLATPEYTEVDLEWDRVHLKEFKRDRKRLPRWTSLFSGPKTVRQLAKHLKHGAAYEVLYSEWSETLHAGGAMSTISGVNEMRSLRNTVNVQHLAAFSTGFILSTMQMLISYYVPERLPEYSSWYKRSIRPLYQGISSEKLLRFHRHRNA